MEISWELLVEVATVLHRWESPLANHLSYIPTSDLKVFNLFSRVSNLDRFRHNWRKSQGTDLLSLMRYFGHRKASDDRDRVYALLGLCNQAISIWPNYQLDVTEVFMAPIIETIRNTKSLSVLYGDHSRKTRRDLPSWVPDWSTELDENQRQRAALSSLFDASKGATPILITDTSKTSEHEFIKQEMTLLLDSLKAEVDTRALLRKELAQKLQCLDTEPTSPLIEEIKHLCEALANYCHEDGHRNLPKYGLIHHSRHSLAVHGIKIATVSKITEPLYAASDRSSIVEVLRKWLKVAMSGVHFDENQESFLKTILSDAAYFRGACLKRLDTEDTKALMWWLDRTISPNSRAEGQILHRTYINLKFGHFGHFSEVMKLSATNRTLFLNDQKLATDSSSDRSHSSWHLKKYEHMGLGPMLIKEGDEIYILPGSNLPLVLRPVSQDYFKPFRKYQLIGDCFLHGIMDGELGETGGNILDYLDYLKEPSRYRRSSSWKSSGNMMSFEAGRYFVSPGDYGNDSTHGGEAGVGDLVALEIV